VSIATFIPKPHTPFQWDEQIPIEEAMRKQELLLKHAKQRRLTIRCHDARMSALEGIFARGDRRLSQVLLEAYLRGCRFDGWDEYFNWDAWLAAFDACEIDPWSYLRKRDFDDPLPWDHVDCLVSKSFLQSERMRAVNGAVTPDCRWKGCQGCGVNSAVEQLCERIVITHRDAHKVQGVSRQVSENVRQRYAQVHQMMALEPQQRVRFQFTKLGDLRFLSHLELTKALIRALRRAQLPIAYSRGFNPQPRLAFGPASPVGIESEAEYADAWLERWVSTNDFIQLANAQLPCGCRIVEAVSIPLNADAIAVQLKLSIYQAYVPARLIDGNLQERIARRLSSDEPLIALRETPKGRRRVDIRKVLSNAAVQMVGEGMWMVELHLEDSQSAKGRPDDALRVLCDLDDDALHEIRIIKRSSLCDVNGLLISPLAIVPHHS
ncbi:MAG TPA: DUF2344 domain-containing protein, partial [Armatimonadetes bacterium]|nr:DUF2344 domain-containing protein [Armatimonadota bacterium]